MESCRRVVPAARFMHRTGRRFGGPFEVRLPGRGAQPLSTRESTIPNRKMLCMLCTAMPTSALR